MMMRQHRLHFRLSTYGYHLRCWEVWLIVTYLFLQLSDLLRSHVFHGSLREPKRVSLELFLTLCADSVNEAL